MFLICFENIKHYLHECSNSSQDNEKHGPRKNTFSFIWKHFNEFKENWSFQNSSTILFSFVHPVTPKHHVEDSILTALGIIPTAITSNIADIFVTHNQPSVASC